MLGGISARNLMPPSEATSNSSPAGTCSGTVQSSSPCSIHRAMLKGRSSRQLLSTALFDGPTSERSNPATPGATADAEELRATLTGKSSKRLTPKAADADSDWQEQNSTPTRFRAMLSGKSFRKLLTTPVMDSDSEAGSPTKQPWQEPCPSSTPSSDRAQLSGKSFRKLMSAKDSDSSACTPAQQPSQLFDLSTSTNPTKSKLVGKSSRRLLLSASCTPLESEDNTLSASDGGSNTPAGVRSALAGKSFRQLLHVLDSAADSEVVTPIAGRSTACSTLLSGRSSRKLGSTDLHSTASATPAAIARGLGTPNSAMLLSRSSGKLLSLTTDITQQSSCGVQTPQLGTDGVATGSCSQLSTDRLPSSRALLAGRSSRRLLGLAALAQPQLSESEQLSDPHSDDDGALADVVVHIKFTDSSMDASKAVVLGKSIDNIPVGAAVVCTAASGEQRAKIDSLALLLSNAAEKDVLLDAVAELQGLAAGSSAVRLAIGQHPQVVQGLADLLDDSDFDLQCAAVALICDLASGVLENQSLLGTNTGLVSGLVQLLRSTDTAVRANAAVALWAVAADNYTVQEMVGCNGGHKMVEYVARMLEDPITSRFAAALVWALVSGHMDNQALFAGLGQSSLEGMHSGVVGQLLMLVEVGSDSEQDYAAGALQCLLAGHERVIKLAKVLGVSHTARNLLEVVSSGEAAASLRSVLQLVGV